AEGPRRPGRDAAADGGPRGARGDRRRRRPRGETRRRALLLPARREADLQARDVLPVLVPVRLARRPRRRGRGRALGPAGGGGADAQLRGRARDGCASVVGHRPRPVGWALVRVLNFYSAVFADQLRNGRKTATIRLGDKSHKYRKNDCV